MLLLPLEESGCLVVDFLWFWVPELGSDPWVLASQDQCVCPHSALQDLASAVSFLPLDQADVQGVQDHVEVVLVGKLLVFDEYSLYYRC